MIRLAYYIFLTVFLAAGLAYGSLSAGDLAVPVMEKADGDLDTCALGKVSGLNPKGDNFLSVRAGPGTNYKMLDKIHTNDHVWMFSEQGDWIGIVYGVESVECSPIKADRVYNGPGKTGWVHKKFISGIAG